jgi:hypothetical protein
MCDKNHCLAVAGFLKALELLMLCFRIQRRTWFTGNGKPDVPREETGTNETRLTRSI